MRPTSIPSELLSEPRLEQLGTALGSMNEVLESTVALATSIERMQAICRLPQPDSAEIEEFESLKVRGNELMARLGEWQGQGSETPQLLRVSSDDGADCDIEINLQLPRLSTITKTLYTSFAPDMLLNQHTLQDCVDQRRQLRLPRNATVQGVRIFSRYPYNADSSPQRAINSLASVTGTRVCMLGNTLYPRTPSRCTGMPLSQGEIAINGVEVPQSDGTAVDLVHQMNLCSEQSGVHARLTQTRRIVLQCLDGEAIRLAIRSQSAAILSGYSMGVIKRPSNSSGIPVWFEQPGDRSASPKHAIEFDSIDTGLALTGRAVTRLKLNAMHWDDMHCRDQRVAQISQVFLEQMKVQLALISKRCRTGLHDIICQLENLVDRCFILLKDYLVQLQQAFFPVHSQAG